MKSSCTALVVWLLALLNVCSCHIYSLQVTNDARRVIDLGAFGLGKGGVMQLEIKSLSVSDPVAEKSNKNIGFTFDWVKTALTARHEKNYAKGEGARRGRCFIDDSQVQPSEPPPDWRKMYPLEDKLAQSSPVVQSYEKHTITTPGMYALFFYNCKKLVSNAAEQQVVPVTFEVTVTLYNIDAKGNISYLSYGKTMLPEMYACFTVLFLSCLGGWIFVCIKYSSEVHRIHHVMTSLLILKILSLFCYSMKELWVQHGGQVTAWNYLYHTFLMLKGIMLFAVILLIGTGWSLFHPYLSERDKRTLAVIIPLQIMINISIAVIQETSEGSASWAFWRDSLLLFDVICCCVILLPIILSIKKISETRALDGKEEATLERLRSFRTFYAIVVSFIYFTRIVVPFIETALPYEVTWIAEFLAEIASLIFYIFAGVRFGPKATKPTEPQSEEMKQLTVDN